ncbi:MAG: hypothetical protein K2N72_11655 [Oscillospiraceae bacterium]|nr:hypothetical protein [Oscillospiraceae bacterium]
MKIIIENDLEYNKLGKSLFGKIYLTSEGFDFPDEEWTDFVFPILEWWANELTAKRNTSRQLQLLFMDGSFEMTGEITRGRLLLQCRNSYSGEVLGTIECGEDEFRKNVIDGLRLCKKKFTQYGDKKSAEKCSGIIMKMGK